MMVYGLNISRCPYCDSKIEDFAKFCVICGHKIQVDKEIDLKKRDFNESEEFNKDNVWLLSDPVAIANFEFGRRISELEQDIRYSVMRGEQWQEIDIIYLKEIKRLLKKGSIKKTTSFWFCSPFPTIYKALEDNEIIILGKKIPFKKGDEIVWQCQMARELRNLDGPVLIGVFTPKRMTMYCKEMENAMKGKRVMIRS